MGLSGYARADFRMNNQGEIFLLDVNPMPSIFGIEENSADTILKNDPKGYYHFVDALFEAALLRKMENQQFL